MKNICFFNSTSFLGGGEKKHFAYAKKFREKGYNVIIAARGGSPLFNLAKANQFKTIEVNIKNWSFLNPFMVKIIKDLFVFNEIDSVIFNGSADIKIGGIAAKRAKVERIVYLRGIAVAPSKSFINKRIFSKILTHIVSNSKQTKSLLLQSLGSNFPADKIKVIYNGVDFSGYKANPPKNPNDPIVLGNAARLTRQKGQKSLIDLAKRLKKDGINFRMLIAGEGPLKNELQNSIEAGRLSDQVKLLGHIDDIPTFYQQIDVLVFPSLWEGFGFSMVEAMACEIPVVAFNISSNPEIIEDAKTGYLVEFENDNDLYNKTRMLMNDSSLRREMGKQARLSVLKRFNIDDRVKELEAHLLKG